MTTTENRYTKPPLFVACRKQGLPIVVILILILSCKSNKEIDLVGQWELMKVKDGKIIQPFKSFCPTSHPEYFPCKEVVYISEDKIELPLMIGKQGFKAEDKFIKYEVNGNKIRLFKDSITYEYDLNYFNNKVCFDGGSLCLVKISEQQTIIDSTIFKFQVTQEFDPSYTVWLNFNYRQNGRTCEIWYNEPCKSDEVVKIEMADEEMNYILKLLGRIPEKNLNRIYNNGLSDCREISIDFYTSEGNWKGIETCDTQNENPFEIRALTTNMFWIMHKYLKK